MMYYLFGAGNYGICALMFFGEKNILAVVDNSSAKVGTMLLNTPVISFAQLLDRWKGETIIITAYARSSEVAGQLENAGIHGYFVCPDIKAGFYSCDKMIDKWNLLRGKNIAIYDRNPISEMLAKRIEERKSEIKINYITDDEWKSGNLVQADMLIVAKKSCEKISLPSSARVVDIYEKMADERKEEYQYLAAFKNCRKGEKCFLIGNGPSLQAKDLQKIWENKIASFGCNGIMKIFDETDWRPDYYVLQDSLAYEKYKNEDILDKSICFVVNVADNVKREKQIYPYAVEDEMYSLGYPSFSDDIVTGAYAGRTVMYVMLQIAAYMGFSEIYLLGVDFSWGEDGRNTHFAESYMDKMEDKACRENIRYKEEIRHAYIAARRYADAHGIKIYNATRGGYLDVFERADFDELAWENMLEETEMLRDDIKTQIEDISSKNTFGGGADT